MPKKCSYNNCLILKFKKFIIFFYLFYNIKSQDYFDSLICLYPKAYTMYNGNNILICSNGIYIYNSNFKKQLNFKAFSTEISSYTNAGFINIAQYPNNGYIIITTISDFYLLSSEGEILFNTDINFDNSEDYYTLVPYLYNGNYNFILGFINSSKVFDFIYYNINIFQKSIGIIKEFSPPILNINGGVLKNLLNGLDCQIMYSDSYGELLTCFHFDLYPGEMGAFSLYLNSDIELISDLCLLYKLENISPYYLKAVASPDKSKALIGLTTMYSTGYYLIYDINSRNFTSFTQYFSISPVSAFHFQVQYFSRTHEYIISVTDKRNYKMAKFDENMNIIIDDNLNSEISPDFSFNYDYYGINLYNIVFIPEIKNYVFIMDSNFHGNITARFYYLPDYFPLKQYIQLHMKHMSH